MSTATAARTATAAELAASLRAEQRAVEYGAHAWLNDDGSLRVRSESQPGRWHTVRFHGVAGLVRFSCGCDRGQRFTPDGLCGCWHHGAGARRLEREGLIRNEGGWWVPTEKAEALASRPDMPADPFAGLS